MKRQGQEKNKDNEMNNREWEGKEPRTTNKGTDKQRKGQDRQCRIKGMSMPKENEQGQRHSKRQQRGHDKCYERKGKAGQGMDKNRNA